MTRERYERYLAIIASPATPERLREVCRKRIRADELLRQVEAQRWRLIRNGRLLDDIRRLGHEVDDLLAIGVSEAEVRQAADCRTLVVYPEPRTERDLWLNP